MTDLSDFGAGVESAAETEAADEAESGIGGYGDSHEYRTGRCRAITTDGDRCGAPSDNDAACCHMHRLNDGTVTIDDGPVDLIEATTRTVWRNFENELVRAAVAEVTDA